MKAIRALWAAAHADFRERTRGDSFWVALALAAWLAYAIASGRIVLRFESYQGDLNSAWLGSVIAMIATVLLGWAGFFLVNSSLDRDRRTGVGELIAATPLSSMQYVMAKWLSNFAVLALMVAMLMVACVFLQWRHMQGPIDFVALLAPLAFVALPLLAVVAAFAVLFECVRILRGGLGNLIWLAGFSVMVTLAYTLTADGHTAFDPFGLRLLGDAMKAAVTMQYPDYDGSMSLTFMSRGELQSFQWRGVDWTGEIAFARLFWFAAALAIVLFASMFFDRFDPVRAFGSRASGEAPSSDKVHAKSRFVNAELHAAALSRTPIYRLMTEMYLMSKSVNRWWYAIAIALAAGGFFAPSPQARGNLLLLTWIWPVFIWSAMGCRERAQGTGQLVFSTAKVLPLQLPVQWFAGVTLAVLTGSGVLLNMLLTGDITGLTAWMTAALFIPSLALALGATTGTSKSFEVIYVLLCYVGPLNGVQVLDFMGAGGSGSEVVWFAFAAFCACIAFAARWRELNG
jgi:hypothetical protein